MTNWSVRYLAFAAFLVFGGNSLTFADEANGIDFAGIQAAFKSIQDEAPKVGRLVGQWVLISRQSAKTARKVSAFPDGSDPMGFKNSDGSISTLTFSAAPETQGSCYGFKIESWGKSGETITNDRACPTKFDLILNKYNYDTKCTQTGCRYFLGGKPLAVAETDFPFAPPLTTSCRLGHVGTRKGTEKERLYCVILADGNNEYIGAMSFERKGE